MRYKYGKYTPSPLDELDMDELMSKLSDLLLASGFQDPYFSGDEDERSMQALYDAILEALLSGSVLPEETLQQLLGDQADDDARAQLEQLINQIIERMQETGYITPASPTTALPADRQQGPGGMGGGQEQPTRFEVTDKAIDFLGYRALRDLLGSLGKSSFGRHDTRDLATGIEASGATKAYEFGDTLNLDANATVLNAIRRTADQRKPGGIIDLEYEDLVVAQGGIPEFLRDSLVARHQSQHDSLRRGSIHSGQARGPGAIASDSNAVSGRLSAAGAVPRLGGRSSNEAARAGGGGSLSHEHARRPAAGAANPDGGEEGHAADHHDHGWKAIGDDAAERKDLQERVWTGSDDS